MICKSKKNGSNYAQLVLKCTHNTILFTVRFNNYLDGNIDIFKFWTYLSLDFVLNI